MDIQFRINDEERGSFFIEQDGEQVAELDFEVKDNLMNVYHTGVRLELEGQGIAGRLFNEMVDYARKKGYLIIPSCPYVLAKFRRRPDEYSDIWSRSEDDPGVACRI